MVLDCGGLDPGSFGRIVRPLIVRICLKKSDKKMLNERTYFGTLSSLLSCFAGWRKWQLRGVETQDKDEGVFGLLTTAEGAENGSGSFFFFFELVDSTGLAELLRRQRYKKLRTKIWGVGSTCIVYTRPSRISESQTLQMKSSHQFQSLITLA